MRKGTVKWFNPKKGFGFILDTDGNEVFVHQSDIQMIGFRSLSEDDIVSFDIDERADGKKQAINVVPIVTVKGVKKLLRDDGLYLRKEEMPFDMVGYIVVDANNVLQTDERGMSLEEVAVYAGMNVEVQ